MKIFSTLLAIFLVALWADAQPTAPGGYTPKANDMRIVDGKMYNRILSTNWVTLPAPGATLQVMDATSNGLVVKSSAKTGEQMVIKHHPEEKKLAKGSKITTSFRAMPVAGVKYGDQTVTAFDCGLANTVENRKGLTNGPIHAVQ